MKYILFLAITVLIIICIFLVKRNNGLLSEINITKSEGDSMIAVNRFFYEQAIIGAQFNNGIHLKNVALKDENDNNINLKNAVQGEPKLVIRNDENGCGLCIENELNLIKKYINNIGINNILIITNYSNIRKIKVFKRDNNIEHLHVYTVQTLGIPYEKTFNKPFIFILDSSLLINNFFIPEVKDPKISELYYNSIFERYYKSHSQ